MISYPDIEKIIVSTDDAVKAFKVLYNDTEEELKLLFLIRMKKVLSQSEYSEKLISLIIEKQVKHDGHVNHYSKEHDTPFLNNEDSALDEIDATNNWIERRQSEIISIQTFIENKIARLQVPSKIEIFIPIKISEDLQSEEVINILYDGLHPKYINLEKGEFVSHFTNSTFQKINWLGTDIEIKFLFDWLTENNVIKGKNQNKLIYQHFITATNRELTSKRLSSVLNNSAVHYSNLQSKSSLDITHCKKDKSYKLLQLVHKIHELL